MELQNKLVVGLDLVRELKDRHKSNKFIIAGGAVRDQIMGKEINDVDIYTNLDILIRNDYNSLLKGIDLFFGDTISNISRSFNTPYFKFNVLTIKLIDGNVYEIISTSKSVERILNSFDVGLCQAKIVDEVLFTTHLFDRDRDNKTLTVYPNKLQPGQIVRCIDYHLPKLMAKYPNFLPRIEYT